ncbi:tetratricopeptide repeat protein [uncultured Desulfosarcina sp.]|uniref:tetratricopeptide repeat protein n=1 Tax=uncultured Desulfosarcina sp. TaxID=218289 RepID=UPI0029C7A4C0|nr:tetratricopeptide repeat protein [uncultured Desulfosarcina sp.]
MKLKKKKKRGSSSKKIALTIENAFSLAFKLHQGGNVDEAEMLYGRIIESVPNHLDALHFYGVLCHQQQRKQEAAQLIGRIIEIDPKNADAHNNLGNVLEGMGRVHDAEICYRQAIALNPGHAQAFNNLGVVLMARKAVDEALDVYGQAIHISPETADYRYNLGNALRKCERIDDAVAAYHSAVELDATHVGAWQGLSRTLIKSDRKGEAKQVFDAWLEKDPENPIALYLQASCMGKGAPSRAPDAFVQKTFDDLADSFDEHLQGNLDYRAPPLLIEALANALPQPAGSLNILDAGCGTGLCGPLLKPYASHLVGVDLSAGMLTRAKGVIAYDEIIQAELTEFLTGKADCFDAIVSADTLCYFGDLEPVLKRAAGALQDRGVMAFTLEDAGQEIEGWQLNPHGRYAHTGAYVEHILGVCGFDIQIKKSVILRNEGGQPVKGHLVVATTMTRHAS